LFFVNRYEKSNVVPLKNEEDEDTEDSVPQPDGDIQENPTTRSIIPHRRTKLLLCGLCLATYGTVEIGHFAFSAALFQNLDIHLSAATSAHVMSILSSTYTLGRLTSAFISIKLQPDTIIAYHYVTLFGAITMLYYGRND